MGKKKCETPSDYIGSSLLSFLFRFSCKHRFVRDYWFLHAASSLLTFSVSHSRFRLLQPLQKHLEVALVCIK